MRKESFLCLFLHKSSRALLPLLVKSKFGVWEFFFVMSLNTSKIFLSKFPLYYGSLLNQITAYESGFKIHTNDF